MTNNQILPDGIHMACKYNPAYEIYRDGRLYSLKREKFICSGTNGKNSPYIHYRMSGNSKKYYVHRMVADHFHANPMNFRDVHHIDNNPKNNHADNLRWLSHKDNCALKTYMNPRDMIQIKDNRFIHHSKTSQRWSFTFSRVNYPAVTKTFRNEEDARKCRANYFDIHFPLAEEVLTVA